MSEQMGILLTSIAAFVVSCIVLCYVVFEKMQSYHIFLEKLYRRPRPPVHERIHVVTTADAQGVELILITAPGQISDETAKRLMDTFGDGLAGTSLEGTKTLVMGDGLQVHFIKTRKTQNIPPPPDVGGFARKGI